MLENAKKITVIGGGIWGQTLANLARRNHLAVRVWSRHSGEDLGTVIADTEVIISAVSIKGVAPTIEKLQQLQLNSRIVIVTATKGLDPITTRTPFHLWNQAFPDNSLVVLSGPNLAKEINQGLPAATVVASYTQKAAILLQKLLSGESFRVYLNSDPLGTELGGTLKNVMAIASGVCDGLQLGTNAKSALLTRALPEIVRVGTCLGGCQETFFGLSGLGDLLATCNSPLSRNYQVGYQLALGLSLPEILAKLEGTAEGINTTEVLMRIAPPKNLYVPITCQVDRLLRGEISPQVAVDELMRRDLKAEFD
ncbi:NAD(P)H-dependent glycerol-3-phosphate dehydrogenase [Microcystis wesenbergii FACHB-1317]|uniref:NAD(P)H-dependent glycerol-3-phosphate dehydrogenase n=1 Tax=Microcystis TaxID=1125 RepID=UPI000E362E37|nr:MULTISPECIES: NAD(P)H-dependent glycerol-3-phosphate dehydrogenase [Microcystis]MBD2291543.1 NAD(P)H-dependent glycerol-3-phosphate dehydrogenase [Microcystis wesenbergii FACHB-1317]REJ58018.1 MAG: NAD(P)H-dependent glycerol-3-phosphate dehydrogenase [Microcystis aeruginosa TA09]UZO78622.1 NAD(P)H-dependent glycerol-3-phosphate dehydrogenase [Microcystis aeruginosa str. Chao 1910]